MLTAGQTGPMNSCFLLPFSAFAVAAAAFAAVARVGVQAWVVFFFTDCFGTWKPTDTNQTPG